MEKMSVSEPLPVSDQLALASLSAEARNLADECRDLQAATDEAREKWLSTPNSHQETPGRHTAAGAKEIRALHRLAFVRDCWVDQFVLLRRTDTATAMAAFHEIVVDANDLVGP